MRTFGMITTVASADFTDVALKSFFAHTELGEGETLILIDNDGAYGRDRAEQFVSAPRQLEYQLNEEPKSFAANMNTVMRVAHDGGADAFLLNNDLAFFPNWIDPLLECPDDEIVSPLCNQQLHLQAGEFTFEGVATLGAYATHGDALEIAVRDHYERQSGRTPVIALPFFCVKIPLKILKTVGYLDELFGVGGGEDNDYCVRAYLAGFSTKFVHRSYVLHFNGRSTWGAEDDEQSAARCTLFKKRFTEKWGELLMQLCIEHNLHVLEERPEVYEAAGRGDYLAVVNALKTS